MLRLLLEISKIFRRVISAFKFEIRKSSLNINKEACKVSSLFVSLEASSKQRLKILYKYLYSNLL